jgi:hypothetical protein
MGKDFIGDLQHKIEGLGGREAVQTAAKMVKTIFSLHDVKAPNDFRISLARLDFGSDGHISSPLWPALVNWRTGENADIARAGGDGERSVAVGEFHGEAHPLMSETTAYQTCEPQIGVTIIEAMYMAFDDFDFCLDGGRH